MLFTWCLLGGLIVMFAPSGLTSKLQLAYTYVFSWPLSVGQRVSLAGRTLSPLVVNDAASGQVAAEHRRLMNQIANLEAQVKEARQEINQLSHIRKVMPQLDRMDLLPADITVNNHSQDVLFINRGAKDDVAVGQFVMAEMSIIGTISAVFPRTATVRLITNPDSKVPVIIGESGLPKFMNGQRGNIAKIPLLRASDPVSKGTKVYAKKPGLLDVPVIAGEVSQCRIDLEHGSVLDVTVRPVCDISRLTNVVVIVAAPQK